MRGPVGAITAGLVVLVAAWFALPQEAVIQRSAVIAAPPDVVYGRLVDVEAMQGWSPWVAADPKLQVAYGATRAGEGASFTWSGDAGSGSWTVTEVEAQARVNSALVMGTGAEATSTMELTPDGEGTKVTWTVVARAGGARGGLFALNADGLIGPTLEDGLKRLGEVAK